MATDKEDSTETVSSYRDYEQEAHELVAIILKSSVERLIREQSEQALKQKESSEDTKPPVEWPTGENFTIEKGLEAIDCLVKVFFVTISASYTCGLHIMYMA